MMIFRRILAVILAFVFVALYLPVLVVFRVNDTAGNPDFYVDQLRKADIYNFIYDKAIPAAIDEMDTGNDNTALDLSRYKANVMAIIEQALPRQYVQEETEASVKTVLPYLLGDVDSFTLTVPLKDRVKAAAAAAKTELAKKEFFAAFYDNMISQLVDAASDNTGQIPLALTRDELESTLRTMVPLDWMQAQLITGIDQMVPYLTKEKDSFSFKVDISDRINALQTVVTNNLKKPENYNSLFDNISETALGSGWQSGFQLPVGIQLTSSDIRTVMKQVLTLEWYQSVVPQVVNQVFDYLKGNTNSLQVTIQLADRKPALNTAVAQLADRKLEAYVNSLPVSTPLQLAQMLANPPIGRLPDSRPLALSYAEIKQLLRIDIGAQIAPLVTRDIPDRWVLSDSDMSSILGAGQGGELLNGIRNVIRSGYTLTDQNLRDALGAKAGSLDKARQYVADGLVLTQQDLKTRMFTDLQGKDAQNFERIRQDLGSARRWKMVLWVLPGLVLVAIGFLGGRRWSSRLMWVAATLLATAILVMIAAPPVSSAVQTAVHDQLSTSFNQGSAFQSLISAKIDTVALNVVRTFFSGMQKQMLALLFTSLALLLASIVWYRHEIQHGKRL